MKTKYILIDIETTGSNYRKNGEVRENKILQIAIGVLDDKMRSIRKEYWTVNHDLGSIVRTMDTTVMKMHLNTGLLQDIEEGKGSYMWQIEREILSILSEYAEYKLIAVGNNIQFDMTALHRELPKVASLFHYSYLDVSSIRKGLSLVLGDTFKKAVYSYKENKFKRHPLTDIIECEKELNLYLNLFKNKSLKEDVDKFISVFYK